MEITLTAEEVDTITAALNHARHNQVPGVSMLKAQDLNTRLLTEFWVAVELENDR